MTTACPRCRAENTDMSKYCSSCAAPLTDSGGKHVGEGSFGRNPVPLFETGRIIAGKYKIINEIGRGGMGVIYKAEDIKLQRPVALKFLPEDHSCGGQAEERFQREARAASALNHPNICTIFDIDEADGRQFIAMELLEGRSLREHILENKLDFEAIVDWGIQIASGLEAAHAKGIVHRDIKPGNIFVTGQGQAKILDFGLAKRLSDEGLGARFAPGQSTLTVQEPITNPGSAVGTAAYMSPEQALGKPLDARTDIFSFGAVLYEMAAGAPPFRGDTTAALFDGILNRSPISATRLNPVLPPELDRIIAKAMEKDREVRYQTIKDLKVDLKRLRRDQTSGITATQPSADGRRGRRRSLAWTIGLSAAGLALAAAAILWVGPKLFKKSDSELKPTRIAVMPFENRTGDPTLDSLGRTAAEAVAEGLARIDTVEVLPASAVSEAAAAMSARSAVSANQLARATGAGLVVGGAIHLEGEAIRITASVTDVIANRPLYAIQPSLGSKDKPMEAASGIRDRISDVIAARYLNQECNLLAHEVDPPKLEAQREFLAGWRLFGADLAAAIGHFNRAIALEQGFVMARIALHMAFNNQGRYAEAAEGVGSIRRMEERLTPYTRRILDWLKANMDPSCRIGEILSANRGVVAMAPENVFYQLSLLFNLIWSNRPSEVVGLARGPIRWDLQVRTANTIGVLYFVYLATSLHQLGDHEAELKEARQGEEVYPDLLNLKALEARALTALGRRAEVEALVDEILATPSRWGYPSCCMPVGTPGYVMLAVSEELRVHGAKAESLAMADRAVSWYQGRSKEEAGKEETGAGLGEALYRAERWAEAKSVFEALLAGSPGNVYYLGWLGALAARRGDRAEALRFVEELGKNADPMVGFCGQKTFRKARIMAILGDRDASLTLLREAVAEGAGSSEVPDSVGYGFIFPHCMDLESLRGDKAFQELIKPKG